MFFDIILSVIIILVTSTCWIFKMACWIFKMAWWIFIMESYLIFFAIVDFINSFK